MDNSYLHNIDPFLIQLGSSFGLRWYGFSYLLGFILTYGFVRYLAAKGRSPLTKSDTSELIFYLAMGTVIGGRLGYCIMYSPNLLFEFTASPPFWGVLAINDGGMASHGGIAGIIIAALLYSKKFGISVWHCMDIAALGGSIGIFFGRIANFINGELVGRACPTDFPLAVKFPQDILIWPSYATERLPDLAPVVSFIGVTKSEWSKLIENFRFNPESWTSLHVALESILIRIQSGDPEIASAIRPILEARYPSQLFQGVLEGLLIFICLAFVWRKPRKPGLITSLFLILYPIMRIIGEQFRLPDPHIGYQLFGLTRGQWLSALLLAVGVLMFLIWRRSSETEAKKPHNASLGTPL